jgi:diguanylate cyclase (GGDEF)-like protein
MRGRLAIVLLVWTSLAVVTIAVVARQQRASREDIDERFALRATFASRFVASYVDDVFDREASIAKGHLASPTVSRSQFDRIVEDQGFKAAVLLDKNGRVLRVYPHKQGVIGAQIAKDYAHLSAAERGRRTVSEVVPSAARQTPIVGFALPFDTSAGRRVYSGAHDVASAAAGTYLRNAIPFPRSRLYLIDSVGAVIAKNGSRLTEPRPLAAIEPKLARRLAGASAGSFDDGDEQQRFESARVQGTPWRVVVAVPAPVLYSAVSGGARWMAWAATAAFLVALLVALLALLRVSQGRRKLAQLNDQLEEIVRIDVLTGLYNRRGLDEQLARAMAEGRRHGRPVAVVLFDVDHFKRVNDTHGHLVGDQVLAQLARLTSNAMRKEDLLGRWGGEEFLAILPDTDLKAAEVLAWRLRNLVAERPLTLPGGEEIAVTMSAGVTAGFRDVADEHLRLADRALYRAKSRGRNRVVACAGDAAEPAVVGGPV